MYDLTQISDRLYAARLHSKIGCLADNDVYTELVKPLGRLESIRDDTNRLLYCDMCALYVASQLYGVNFEWLCGGASPEEAYNTAQKALSAGDINTLLEKTRKNLHDSASYLLQYSGMSINRFANYIGTATTSVTRCTDEDGLRVPVLVICKMANAFKLPISWFVREHAQDAKERDEIQRSIKEAGIRMSRRDIISKGDSTQDTIEQLTHKRHSADAARMLDLQDTPVQGAALLGMLHGLNPFCYEVKHDSTLIYSTCERCLYDLNKLAARLTLANAAKHNILLSPQLPDTPFYEALVVSDTNMIGQLELLTLSRAYALAQTLSVDVEWLCGKGTDYIVPAYVCASVLKARENYEYAFRKMLGTRLSVVRHRLNYSLRDFEDLTGISRTTLSNLEKLNAISTLTLVAACRLSVTTGIPLNWFCGEGTIDAGLERLTPTPKDKRHRAPRKKCERAAADNALVMTAV